MKYSKRILIQLVVSVISLLLSSACILFVPIAYNHHIRTLICSVLFWGFLIIGYIAVFMMFKQYKASGYRADKKRIAILTFFRNPAAKLIDVVLIISLTLLIISEMVEALRGGLQYFLIFLTVFLIHMHSLFNSDTYRFIQSEVRREIR